MKKSVIMLIGIFILFGLFSTSCTKVPVEPTSTIELELTKFVPEDIPMFFYLDLKAINADEILTRALSNTEEFDYEAFKQAGFNPEGKMAFLLTEVSFDEEMDETPTFALMIPSSSPEDMFNFIKEQAEKDGEEAEITEEDGFVTVVTDDETLYFMYMEGYLSFAMGEGAKDLLNSMNSLSADQTIENSDRFKEAMTKIDISNPVLVGFVNGSFYTDLWDELQENMQDEDLPESFFDFPEVEFAVFASEVTESEIIFKSYGKYAEEVDENSMLAMYFGTAVPDDAFSIENISGDVVLYFRMILNMEAIKNFMEPFMDKEGVDFSEIGLTADEFWGMLRGDIQLVLADFNFMLPKIGGVVGIQDKTTFDKIMTIAMAATEGKLQVSGNTYTMSEGNNEMVIEVEDNHAIFLVNMESIIGDDPSVADVFTEAGISNPDEYPFLMYMDIEAIAPSLKMFLPKLDIDFLKSFISASKIEGTEAEGIMIITGTGNILDDLIDLIEEEL